MVASKSKVRQAALKAGYRSGFEEAIAKQLKRLGVVVDYEKTKIIYHVKETRTYTPDFDLPNGIRIETKGRFVTADRKKHLLIKAQRPDLDIRFVFYNSGARLSKTSKTTYAAWCEKNGFLYADKEIPLSWLMFQKSTE